MKVIAADTAAVIHTAAIIITIEIMTANIAGAAAVVTATAEGAVAVD